MRKILALLIVSSAVTTSASADDWMYKPSLNLQGMFQNGHGSYNVIDGLLPLLQYPQTLTFLETRGVSRYRGQYQGDFGLGLRLLTPQRQWLYGANAFYSMIESPQQRELNQVTGGLELQTQHWVFDANGYYSVGANEHLVSSPGYGGRQNIFRDDNIEYYMPGYDGEAGYRTDFGLAGYVGGFRFYNKNLPLLAGPIGRVTYSINNPLDLTGAWSYLLNRVTFESGLYFDTPRRLTWFIGATIRIAGPEDNLTGLEHHMTDDVQNFVH